MGRQKWDALALIKGSISFGSVDLSMGMGSELGIVVWQRPRMRTRLFFTFLIFIVLTLSESA